MPAHEPPGHILSFTTPPPGLERGHFIAWSRGAALSGRPYLARSAEEHSGPQMPWFWQGELQGGGGFSSGAANYRTCPPSLRSKDVAQEGVREFPIDRMRYLATRALVGFTLGLPGLSSLAPSIPTQDAAAPPTFGSRTEIVVVDVVVTGPRGQSVEGLRREDFRLFESGQAHEIASFEAVALTATSSSPPGTPDGVASPTPTGSARTLAVLFDDLHLRPFDAERLKIAVRDLLRTEGASRAQVALIAPGAGIARMGQLPGEKAGLEEGLERLTGQLTFGRHIMSEQEAYEINALRNEVVELQVAERRQLMEPGSLDLQTTRIEVRAWAAQMDSEASRHRKTTLETLARTITWLSGLPGRRSLVLASRGFVYDSGLDGYRRVIEASRRANVPIHLLDARGLEGLLPFQDVTVQQATPFSHLPRELFSRFSEAEGAEQVALDTGGLVLRNRNDLSEGLRLISEGSRSYYLLGFYPRNERRDGRWRKLKVEVAKGPEKREVRARRGYFAPLD
jgi:VWFA-related protein